MPFVGKLESFNRSVARKLEWVGFAALFIMMLVTCIDVAGAKLFLRPIHGALDAVELAQLIAISFAAAATLIAGRHVSVEFLVVMLPKRVRALVEAVVQILGLSLFAIIIWRLARYGYSTQIEKWVSPTARVPLYPFVYGTAFGLIPLWLLLLENLIKSITRMLEK